MDNDYWQGVSDCANGFIFDEAKSKSWQTGFEDQYAHEQDMSALSAMPKNEDN